MKLSKGIKTLILGILAFAGCLPATAYDGLWKPYPTFNTTIDRFAVKPNRDAYFITGNTLYFIAGDGSEHRVFDASNNLNNSVVTDIWYNPEKKFLVVLYEDFSFDILHDDGRAAFVPDIREASMTKQRKINSVDFDGDNILIAGSFGFVIVDSKTGSVKESAMLNNPADALKVMGEWYVLDHGAQVFLSPKAHKHNHISDFKSVRQALAIRENVIVGSNIMLYTDSIQKGRIKRIEFDLTRDGANTLTETNLYGQGRFVPMKGGLAGIKSQDGKKFYVFDTNGELSTTYNFPASIDATTIGTYEGVESMWIGNTTGVSHYNMYDPDQIKVIVDKFRAEGFSSNRLARMTLSPDGNRIYCTNVGISNVSPAALPGEGSEYPQVVDVIENGKILNRTPYDAEVYSAYAKDMQTKYINKMLYGGPGNAVEDPSNPNRYAVRSSHEGIVIIENGKYVTTFNESNMPLKGIWDARCNGLAFDPKGNLWAVFHTASTTPEGASMYFLSKDKLGGDLAKITAEDWKIIDLGSNTSNSDNRDANIVFPGKDMVVYANGWYTTGIYVIDTKGKWDMSDYRSVHMAEISDQDGNKVLPHQITCLYVDRDKRLWIGTTKGLLTFPDVGKMFTANGQAQKIKVPRNDGTNYADYLLDAEYITDIKEDPSGRKWISTANSGLTLVSSSGDKIINTFTSENSPLPSNEIYAVQSDPNSNVVFMSTSAGVVSYQSDASPSYDDYSRITAYPNPVRPEFESRVTITGLMENSLVKITDSAGNLVNQGRSEGGMWQWDCTNLEGRPVKSGVYLILASASEGDTGTVGAVTKVVVIN